MPGLLLILALQTVAPAPAQVPTAAPQRFSILVPIASEPCVRQADSDATVCANPLPSQKLPYPEEIVPDHPVPSNPEMRAAGALAAQSTPCAARLGGCQVGFGPPIVPIIKGVAGLIGDALRKKPDKTGRVAIPLDDSAAPTGRVER